MDELYEIGKYINEVSFLKMPNLQLLENLVESNPEIRVDLSGCECLEIADYSFSENVIKMNYETDCFDDLRFLDDFPDLEELTIYCFSGCENINPEDLSDTQLKIANLKNLKKLTINLKNNNIINLSDVEGILNFPLSDFEYKVIKKKS